METENQKQNQLPIEIMEEILLRLPVKSLLRFKCVCKSWLSLITNLRYIKAHLNQSIENNPKLILASLYTFHMLEIEESDKPTMDEIDLPFDYIGDSTRLMGSCNGLVCLSDRISSTKVGIRVWNPATSDHIKLFYVPPEDSNIPHSMQTGLGFGYAPATDEYKVVVFVDHFNITFNNRSHRTDVIVRTLGMDSWRTIPNVPYSLLGCSQATEFNGALHWIATRIEGQDNIDLIISFDLANEKFRELRLPDLADKNNSLKIAVVGGYFSVFCHCLNKDCFEMWAMNDYGSEQSWTIQFSDKVSKLIGYLGHIYPLYFRRNGEILLEKGKSQLAIYNPANKRIRNLHIRGKPGTFKANTYVESLVSLGVGNDVEEK